jgi:hypothetical protein
MERNESGKQALYRRSSSNGLESLTDDLTAISSRYGNTLFNLD